MKRAYINILGSNIVSQALIVLSTPLLMRAYDGQEFGVLGVSVPLALLLSTLFSCKLEHSIHIDANPQVLFQSALTLVLSIMVLLALPVTWALTPHLGLSNSLLVIAFALFHAVFGCCSIYLNFLQKFRALAICNIALPVAFLSGALLIDPKVSINNPEVSQLLIWQTISMGIATCLGLLYIGSHLRLVRLRHLLQRLQEHKQAIFYLVPSHMLATLSLNISVMGAAMLYDEAIAGLIVVAQRMSRAPVTMIGNALNEVLRTTIPARKELIRTFKRVAMVCFVTATAMIIVIWITPETLYINVVGSEWRGLSDVLRITVIAAGAQLIGTSVLCMLTVFAKRSELMINLALVMIALVAIVAAHTLELAALEYLWGHASITALVYLFAFIQCWRVARQYRHKPAHT